MEDIAIRVMNPVTEVCVVGIRDHGLDIDGKRVVEEVEENPDYYTVYCVCADGARISLGDMKASDEPVTWARQLAQVYNWILRTGP